MKSETLVDGSQSPPVYWGILTARKCGFFERLWEITGEGEQEP